MQSLTRWLDLLRALLLIVACMCSSSRPFGEVKVLSSHREKPATADFFAQNHTFSYVSNITKLIRLCFFTAHHLFISGLNFRGDQNENASRTGVPSGWGQILTQGSTWL